MKLKKIASVLFASIVAASVSAVAVSAVEDGGATYCFDTDTNITDWLSYGSVEQTGTSLSHTKFESKNGEGCIVVSENITGEISDQYGGYYINAEALGLEDFRGCTVEMSVKLCEGAEEYYDNFGLYSDGLIWISETASNLSEDEWTTVSMVVPSGAENAQLGFTIPTFKAYSGDVLYIDDFTVTNSDGVVIANVGDYKVKPVASEEAVSTGVNILMTVLLVLLILVIIGGIGFIVSSVMRKFT